MICLLGQLRNAPDITHHGEGNAICGDIYLNPGPGGSSADSGDDVLPLAHITGRQQICVSVCCPKSVFSLAFFFLFPPQFFAHPFAPPHAFRQVPDQKEKRRLGTWLRITACPSA